MTDAERGLMDAGAWLRETGVLGSMAGALASVAICAVASILTVVGMWGTFKKAGNPGWAAIVPVYNAVVLMRIAGKPWWWIFLLLIPVVNIVVNIVVSLAVARAFGKDEGFAIGLAFLPPVFYCILGFDDAMPPGSFRDRPEPEALAQHDP